MAADIAKLQGAKGVQLGAWLRANKILVIVFAVYVVLVIGAGIVFQHPGASLIAVFWVPVVGLRLWLRGQRR